MTSPFRYYLRVRYQDCDLQHVVFNSRYSEYADLACFEFRGNPLMSTQPRL